MTKQFQLPLANRFHKCTCHTRNARYSLWSREQDSVTESTEYEK